MAVVVAAAIQHSLLPQAVAGRAAAAAAATMMVRTYTLPVHPWRVFVIGSGLVAYMYNFTFFVFVHFCVFFRPRMVLCVRSQQLLAVQLLYWTNGWS